MYIPRHYKVDKKKGPNYWKYIPIFLIIVPIYFGFSYRKKIFFYFSSNHLQKQAKVEKKLLDQFIEKKITKEVLVEYITTSSALLQSDPSLPLASHAMAKGFFYTILLNDFKFNIQNLMGFILEDSFDSKLFIDHYPLLEGMYRNALRADSLLDEYPEQNSNRLFLLLFETLEGRKNSSLILEDLKKIDYERITPDVRLIFTWLSFIASTNAGNLAELDIINDRNKNSGSEGGIEITDREFLFLKGLTAYKSKDYIQALEFLRKCKSDFDFITIEATKLEAMIFFYQNLHEKSITLLEKLYIDLNGTDQSIKIKLQQIVSSKNGLKSKLL